jgi:hypothetical protein
VQRVIESDADEVLGAGGEASVEPGPDAAPADEAGASNDPQ